MLRFFKIPILAAFAALFLSQTAVAQDFPALFSVTDVAAHDVLNIRAEPSARAPIIGSFAPDQTGIEVVGLSEDRRWGLVRVNEGVGWSSMRYLRAERADSWRDGQQHLSCGGTEPFWSMEVFLPGNRVEFFDPETDGIELRNEAPNLPGTRFPPTLAMSFTGARKGFAVVRQGVCSDGMSDFVYGLEMQVYWRGRPDGLSGCCSLGR